MLPASVSLEGKCSSKQRRQHPPVMCLLLAALAHPTSSTGLTIFVQKQKYKGVCDGDEDAAPQGNPRLEMRIVIKDPARTLSSHLVKHLEELGPRGGARWSEQWLAEPQHQLKPTPCSTP